MICIIKAQISVDIEGFDHYLSTSSYTETQYDCYIVLEDEEKLKELAKKELYNLRSSLRAYECSSVFVDWTDKYVKFKPYIITKVTVTCIATYRPTRYQPMIFEYHENEDILKRIN